MLSIDNKQEEQALRIASKVVMQNKNLIPNTEFSISILKSENNGSQYVIKNNILSQNSSNVMNQSIEDVQNHNPLTNSVFRSTLSILRNEGNSRDGNIIQRSNGFIEAPQIKELYFETANKAGNYKYERIKRMRYPQNQY